MSNQRAGKTYKAGARDGGLGDMKLRAFFRTAANLFDEDNDTRFYFEQIVEHISDGGNLTTDNPVAIRRILGL
jgi:hypothetical protein